MQRCAGVFWLGFMFQAEDGIRDDLVTGVQTCGLPIYIGALSRVVARSSTSCVNLLAARTVGGAADPLVAGAGGCERGREISENCLWKAARGIDAEMSAARICPSCPCVAAFFAAFLTTAGARGPRCCASSASSRLRRVRSKAAGIVVGCS